MTAYVDLILHFEDLPASMAAGFKFTGPPAVHNGRSALVYARVTAQEAAGLRGRQRGITVLAEVPYGPGSVDAAYKAVFSSAKCRRLYDEVYDRNPRPDGEGGVYTPPERFGALA